MPFLFSLIQVPLGAQCAHEFPSAINSPPHTFSRPYFNALKKRHKNKKPMQNMKYAIESKAKFMCAVCFVVQRNADTVDMCGRSGLVHSSVG